jgi:hypothetical protein
MTTEPNTAPADDTLEKLLNAVRDEPLLKQLLAGSAARKLLDQAGALIRKKLDSRELSDDMLLRIFVSLARSTDYVLYAAMTWPRHLKPPGRAPRSGRPRRPANPSNARSISVPSGTGSSTPMNGLPPRQANRLNWRASLSLRLSILAERSQKTLASQHQFG